MKLCTECKHYCDLGRLYVIHGCGSDAVGSRIDPVDGKRLYRKCNVARADESTCGAEGKLWESRVDAHR